MKILEPEVDIALTRFKKVALVAEVKWVSRVRREDVRSAERRLSKFPEARKVLIVPNSSVVPETWLEVMDVSNMIEIAKKSRSNHHLI